MSKFVLIATTTFGLEAIVKREIQALGYEIIKTEDGKVTYEGDELAIARSNLWLRSADRVLLRMGEYNATSFEELFEKTKALPWADFITEDGIFTVNGSSVKSGLFSVPDCQSIVKKAIVEKLKESYHTDWFEESGAEYTVKVSILKDTATLTIDTSGSGLHKRGYRVKDVTAPIKETLAAALVQLSFWKADRVLIDPFCGSGTIPIEAALIARNIAPGISRRFASDEWAAIPQSIWKEAKKEAFNAINYDLDLKIYASDIDEHAIESAMLNAEEAGVDDCIEFSTKALADVAFTEDSGIVICNPPYGERIGEKAKLVPIYNDMKRLFKTNDTWSLYLITADESFERIYARLAPDRKRKLFNGRIQTNYYQYYGRKPNK